MITLVNSKDLFFYKSQKWDCYSPSVHQMFTKQIKIHKNKNEMLKTVKKKPPQKKPFLYSPLEGSIDLRWFIFLLGQICLEP